MPLLKFTYALKRFFPELSDLELPGDSLRDLLQAADRQHPGLLHYILDEQGRLRRHVNIFIDGELLRDRTGLSDAVRADSEI
ncbi:MAG: molybdenum cofactor biosynthesis protein MoaD [Bacteroidetes bacterium]|nr:MAG: molybdenum cofactor biosynthesis protein MoaD [Bacteroidota bacterium]